MEPKSVPANITKGIADVSGRDSPRAQSVVESLLEEDRQMHQGFLNSQSFHRD